MFAGGSYGSFPYAGTASTKQVWLVGKPETEAVVKPVSWLAFWGVGKAETVTVVKPFDWNEVWLIGKSETGTIVKPVNWLAFWQVGKAEVGVDVKPITWTEFWEISKSETATEVKNISWTDIWLIGQAETGADVKLVTWLAFWLVGKAETGTVVKPVDLDYIAPKAIPDLTLKRAANGESAEIDLLNSANADLSILQGDDYIAALSEIAEIDLSQLPYTVSGLEPDGSYLFRARFTVSGTKGGQPYSVAGEPGGIRTTIGKNQTL